LVGGLTDIKLVGHFNGAEDGNNIYHDAGYYAFSVQQQTITGNPYLADGSYFVLSPDASSQVKGYVVISTTNLMNNLYSPGLSGPGTAAFVFGDASLQTPYTIEGSPAGTPPGEMNTGANNQWGTVF